MVSFPRWAGGRPRRIGDNDAEVIVAAARTRPEKLGQPFTHWSLRKLAGYLAGRDRPVRVGRERLSVRHGTRWLPDRVTWTPTATAPDTRHRQKPNGAPESLRDPALLGHNSASPLLPDSVPSACKGRLRSFAGDGDAPD